MVGFVNKLEFNNQKYQNSEIVRDESYKRNFLFFMKKCVPFVAYIQSMFFMSNRFLTDNIYGVHVPQFQFAYIGNTTHSSQKSFVGLCHYVHYMVWGNQELKLQ